MATRSAGNVLALSIPVVNSKIKLKRNLWVCRHLLNRTHITKSPSYSIVNNSLCHCLFVSVCGSFSASPEPEFQLICFLTFDFSSLTIRLALALGLLVPLFECVLWPPLLPLAWTRLLAYLYTLKKAAFDFRFISDTVNFWLSSDLRARHGRIQHGHARGTWTRLLTIRLSISLLR